MSEAKLDLIIAQNEQILANQSVMDGGAPPPDTSGEAWIKNDVGQSRRNPEYAGWNPDLWDLTMSDSITQIDVTGIPQRKGVVEGNYVTQYGNYSYDIMVIPNGKWGQYMRSSGNSICRVLDPRPLSNGKHLVLQVCRLSGGSYWIPDVDGATTGDIWVLQCSDQSDVGSVFTNQKA